MNDQIEQAAKVVEIPLTDVTQCDACGQTFNTDDTVVGFECDYCSECWKEAANG